MHCKLMQIYFSFSISIRNNSACSASKRAFSFLESFFFGGFCSELFFI